MRKNAWLWLPWVCSVVACSDAAAPSSLAAAGIAGVSATTAGIGGKPGSNATAGSRSSSGSGGTGGAGQAGKAGSSSGRNGGAGGQGGAAGKGGAGDVMDGAPVCPSSAPDEFEPNTSVGGGGTKFKDSPHFRVYGDTSDAAIRTTFSNMEAAYSCFIEDLCYRSPGLSVNSDDEAFFKVNIYLRADLNGAAGVQQYDARAGLSYLEVLPDQLPIPRVTVHEFGHALALSEHNWVDQVRTGAWWETMANWVADTYLTSPLCEDARTRFGVAKGNTIIDLDKVIGQSQMLIVSDKNLYEAWPFLAYLTNNPDHYPGLGTTAIRDLMRNHPRNNETPLHVLERVAKPVRTQTILGRYWARMAYLDIGHPQAQKAFFDRRKSLNFTNLQPAGNQTYRVRDERRPMYGGANIIPLRGTGALSVEVTNLGNGLPESNFTATVALRKSTGAVRYVDLPEGTGEATVANDEEASLVVVNTPDTLYQYDAFKTSAGTPEMTGLNYQVHITGPAPAN